MNCAKKNLPSIQNNYILHFQSPMNKRIYVYTIPLLCLYACQAVQPLRVQHTYYPLYQQLPSDSVLTNLLNNYRQKLRDTLNSVVAFSFQNWFNKPPEYALGNLMADAMVNSSPTSETLSADVAIVQEKKIRGYWPKGNIRLEQFFLLRAHLDTAAPQPATAASRNGRSGWIRVELQPRPLGQRLWQTLQQFFQRRYQL